MNNIFSSWLYKLRVYIPNKLLTSLISGIPKIRPALKSQIIMKIKLTIVLLISAFLQISVAAYSQKVTLSEKNASLQEIFKKIRKQTSYNIICDAEIIRESKSISVNISNSSLEEALSKCLEGQQLMYSISGKTIVIKRRPRTVLQQVIQQLSGKVSDEKGVPIAGATVRLKGTAVVSSTDANGNYAISTGGSSGILVFSFVGFESREIVYNGQTTMNVILKEQSNALNEVVIGYGSVKQKDIIGAVGVVSIKDLQKAPVVSFDQALAGRVAGVEVRSVDGQPGSAINIVIRGANSLTQSNSPLYVIDDFPIENHENNSLNPADIESI
ncbi:MAG: SusC/RagA family TonB-linked outer membrane protein, partial [Chitinophagaceae bacterium]